MALENMFLRSSA